MLDVAGIAVSKTLKWFGYRGLECSVVVKDSMSWWPYSSVKERLHNLKEMRVIVIAGAFQVIFMIYD